MQILVINPNTSPTITRRIDQAARDAAAPGQIFETRSAPFGPELIVTKDDAAVATRAVLALVDDVGRDFDGIVIASFADTAIEEVRQRVRCPVVGIARCAFLAALSAGHSFSIVSFSPDVAPGLRDIVARYGLNQQLASLRFLETEYSRDPEEIHSTLLEPLIELCIRTQRDGGDAIVLGGGPLAGLVPKIAPRISVPVVDGVTAAVCMLSALVRNGSSQGT